MAIDVKNADSWIAMHDKISDRISKCETELETLFSKPEYATPLVDVGYEEMADYVLMNISDIKKRETFNKEFKKAMTNANTNKKAIEEDFVNLTNKSLETMSAIKTKIDEAEVMIANIEKDKEKFKTEADEMTNLINQLQQEKAEIDAKLAPGGELDVALADAEKAKLDLDKVLQDILDEIKKIDDELVTIQDEIDNCDPADRTKMKDLIKRQKELNKEKGVLQDKYDLEQDKYVDINLNINQARNNITNAMTASSEKQMKIDETNIKLNDKLRDINDIETNLPSMKQELEDDKLIFADKTKEYTDKAQEVSDKLKDKGIDIELGKAEEIEEVSNQDSTNSTPSNNSGNGGGNGGGNSSKQTTPEPTAPAPVDNKRAALDYITGYSNSGVGLTDTERLDRIKSNLLGRDYEQMIMACTDLSKDDVKLTKEEKDNLKNVLLNDKEMIVRSMESLDKNKFESLCNTLGIDISDRKEMEKVSKLYKNVKDPNAGVLDGFTSMDKDSKSLCSDMLKEYYTKKEKGELSEDQIKDIEDNFVTPIKFGTLNKQAKQAYSGKMGKFFDKMDNIFGGGGKLGDQKIKDIQSLIARNETPSDVEAEAVSASKSFGENLKNLIEKGNKEYKARAGRQQEPPVK